MNYAEQVELKDRAIRKLAEQGVWVSRGVTLKQIADQIQKLTGMRKKCRQLVSDYIYRWVGNEHEIINPRYRPPLREMPLFRHPRQADIDAAQPKLWTPKGIGNIHQMSGFEPQVGRLV